MPMMREPVLLLLGPAWLAISFGLMLGRVEPFATLFYLFAWYGLISTFDQLIRRREGRSLIGRCGSGFALIILWSAASWFFFELVNLRLQNWYYVFVADQPLLRVVATFLAFGTVFPGILWIEHYLALRGVGQGWRGHPLGFSPRGRLVLVVLGLLFLILPLSFPAYFFPLVWGFLILLLAPLERRLRIDGLLAQFERGEYGPVLRLLLAGLLAGVFWEFFNFWARAKWIYTVPFFEELKLFEMPVAGFLGFPPFAVECGLLYRLLVWAGLAPAFGGYAPGPARPGRRRLVLAATLGAALFSLGVFALMERYTFTSTTPKVERLESLDPAVVATLGQHGIAYLTDLQGRRGERLWQELAGELSPQQLGQLRRVAGLYLHQGIGAEWGNLLVRSGIGSLEELGRFDAEEVRARLSQAAAPGTRLPTMAQVRLWLRRLPPRASLPRATP